MTSCRGVCPNFTCDQATAKTHADDWITIGKRTYPGDEATEVLGHSLDRLPKEVYESRRVPLGLYRGLKFGLILQPQFSPLVYLEGSTRGRPCCHATITARVPSSMPWSGSPAATLRNARRSGKTLPSPNRSYAITGTRLGAEFSHERYLSELTALRDQLESRPFQQIAGIRG